MIKTIDKLFDNKNKYIDTFIHECTIEEKIDAHYISVCVVDQNTLSFYKRNVKQITNVDCIINKIYSDLMADWYNLMNKHKDVFVANIGKSIKMFYLPTRCPVRTEYNVDCKYIIDTEASDFVFEDPSFIYKKVYKASELLRDDVNVRDLNPDNIIEKAFDLDKMKMLSDKPEGLILKFRNGVYQIINNDKKADTNSSHFYYEYVLKDFINYYKNNTDTVDMKICNKYITTVCGIFNSYIDDWFSKGDLVDSLDAESLEPPYVGTKPVFNTSLISNKRTLDLCRESALYEQVFKILLVNLRNYKTVERCNYLVDGDVKFWNDTVDIIKSYC